LRVCRAKRYFPGPRGRLRDANVSLSTSPWLTRLASGRLGQIVHIDDELSTMCRYILRIADHRADIEPSALLHCCAWILTQQAGREQVAEPMLCHAAKQHRISMGLIAGQFGLVLFARSNQPESAVLGGFLDCSDRTPPGRPERGLILPTVGAAVISIGLSTICEGTTAPRGQRACRANGDSPSGSRRQRS
jgi:hypothetical protein